jgi:hypothetical protein
MVDSNKMIAYFKEHYKNFFYDVNMEHKTKLFSQKLVYMFRHQQDSQLEVIRFYFEGSDLDEFYLVRINIRKEQKSYSIVAYDGIYNNEVEDGFEISALAESQPIMDQLQKEICSYLKKMPEERLRVVLGWKIQIVKTKIIEGD